MERPRTPNILLRSALAEAGWTGDQLARQVNRLGGEIGMRLDLDRRSVAHWLAGRRPRPPVPHLVAEALSRRLGRPVTVSELGWADRQAAEAAWHRPEEADDIVTALIELCGGRRRGSDDRGAGAYSLAALEVPSWPRARQTLLPVITLQAGGPRVRPGHVAGISRMAAVFAASDDAFGGGHSRSALASYLAYDVAPVLRSRAAPALRARLFGVATQLVRLCGYMCFDDEQHALAQRYFQVALLLAVANDDPAAYALTLRMMSAQACLLGHHRQALRLAENAVKAGFGIPTTGRTLLLGQMAAAAAAHGDRAMAHMALAAAESQMREVASLGGASTVDEHVSALTHQQAVVLSLFGEHEGAITALCRSLRARPPSERRSRILSTACLAELCLNAGRLDDAVTVWHRFLDEYPLIRCGRADNALNTMRSRLLAFSNNASVRQLLSGARSAMPSRDISRIATYHIPVPIA